MSDISFELTGAYGKRTKFQQKDLAQLLLKVNRREDPNKEINFVSKWNHLNKDLNLALLPKVNKHLIISFLIFF